MELKIFIVLVIVNSIIGLTCYIILALKKERTKGLLLFLIILLCPIIGAAFFFISWLLQKMVFKKTIDASELSFRKDRIETMTGPDYEKEMNVISVEESLLVSDVDNRRRVILDVLKEDYEKSLTVITEALESDDPETSHYVASIITDVKSNFKITVQKMKENMEKYPEDSEFICLLIDYIHNFLEKRVLSEIEEITYIEMYIQLMDRLYTKHKDNISSKMYGNMIKHMLKIKKSQDAIIWADRVLEEYPLELEAYKSNLKLYFEIGEKAKFFDLLAQLKNSEVNFDNECLEWVRFYHV